MCIECDTLETDIIIKKLSGDIDINVNNIDYSGDGVNIKMLDSLDRMNRTSVNRSYRPIQAEGIKGTVSSLFKRLIRRMTFWFVEPCMMQQTEYNSANNIFSAETNSEINALRSQLENNKRQIAELNGQLAKVNIMLNSMNASFSQSGEDSIIKYIFSTLNRNIESYLDLGANHAMQLSNTYSFYAHGARGVLLEANPALAQELSEKRPEDIVINKCLAEKSGENMDFYILNGDGLSTSDYNAVQEFIKENPALEVTQKIKIDSITINEIIDEYFPEKAPDILNIDIEGMELSILKMTDFEKFRPLVIICEMIEYKNGLTVGQKNQEILDFMRKNDYEEFAFTGINSVFIDKRQGESLS